MTQIMSPSVQEQETVGITDGQIDKASDVLRAALRKYRGEFDNTEAAQQSVTAKELGPDLLAVFRKHYGRFSNLIVRVVRPDRNRTPKAVIDATGRNHLCANDRVVASMPRGIGEEVKVVFFRLRISINDDDLEKEYELRGLKSADPYSLAKVNEDDPAFADEHPNGTHWKDTDGNWCSAMFNRLRYGGREVIVQRYGDDGHYSDLWFAGLAS